MLPLPGAMSLPSAHFPIPKDERVMYLRPQTLHLLIPSDTTVSVTHSGCCPPHCYPALLPLVQLAATSHAQPRAERLLEH